MSDKWTVLAPVYGVNEVLNPILGSSNGYASAGSNSVTLTTPSLFGNRALLLGGVQFTSDGVEFDLGENPTAPGVNDKAFVSFYTDYYSDDWLVNFDGSDYEHYKVVKVRESADRTWYRYYFQIDDVYNGGAGAVTSVFLMPNWLGSSIDVMIDGVQFEYGRESSLICGSFEGSYRWAGEAHNSPSIRPANEYRGGAELDFYTDLNIMIEHNTGASMVPFSVITDNRPNAAGSILDNVQIQERDFELRGVFQNSGGTGEQFHDGRRLLQRIFNNSNDTPRRLVYSGGGVQRYIDAFYVGGLDGTPTLQVESEEVDIVFLATDPYFYSTTESSESLSSQPSVSNNFGLMKRDSTGWGSAGNPSSAGNDIVNKLLYADDGRLYIGGDFTNLDGRSDADYFSFYKPYEDEYANNLELPSNSTGIVYDMIKAPGGGVVICGASGIFGFSGTNYDNSIVGSPSPNANGAVYGAVYDLDGNLWIAGAFTSIDGVTVSAGVAKYDGSAWSAPYSSSVGGTKNGIVMSDAGDIFLTTSAVTHSLDGEAGAVLKWNGYEWAGNSFGALNTCAWIETDGANIFVGLNYSSTGTGVVTFSASADLSSVSGTYVLIYGHAIGPDTSAFMHNGTLYISGATHWNTVNAETGSASIANTTAGMLAMRSPWTWAEVFEPIIPYSHDIYTMETVGDDLYVGGDLSGTTYYPGYATAENFGTAPATLRIEIENTSSNRTRFHGISIPETGGELHFDRYALVPDEVVTVTNSPEGVFAQSSARGDVTGRIFKVSSPETFSIPAATAPLAINQMLSGIAPTLATEPVGSAVVLAGSAADTSSAFEIRLYWFDRFYGVD